MGLSQDDLGEAFGYGQAAMSKVEAGRSNVSWKKIENAATVLGVSPKEFFTVEGDPSPVELKQSPSMPPLTARRIEQVNPTPGGRVLAEIETQEGMLELFLSGEQALYLAKHLERAEERLSSDPAPSVASS